MELGKIVKMFASAKAYIKIATYSVEKLWDIPESWESSMNEDYHPELNNTSFLEGSEVASNHM